MQRTFERITGMFLEYVQEVLEELPHQLPGRVSGELLEALRDTSGNIREMFQCNSWKNSRGCALKNPGEIEENSKNSIWKNFLMVL